MIFRKTVLQNLTPLLKVLGSILALLNTLGELFGGQPLEKLPALQKDDYTKNVNILNDDLKSKLAHSLITKLSF